MTIAMLVVEPIPYGWLGLNAEWQHSTWKDAPATITSVEPGSPAARAGLAAGDRIVGFRGLPDRIMLFLEAPPDWLAVGRTITVTVSHAVGPPTSVQLLGSKRQIGPLWFIWMRLSVYLLGVFVVCALVFVRPSIVTWSFALYVTLYLWPNFWYWQFVGAYASPETLFATILISYWTITLGSLALVTFATRFPEGAAFPRLYRVVEHCAIVFLAIVGAAFMQYQAAQVYGWPTFDYNIVSNAQIFVPALAAIGLLAWTLVRSQGDERVKLAWAIAGPTLCALFQVLDAWLKSIPTLPIVYPTTAGFLSSIAPFTMMYAILRYRVIDIGFALNLSFAKAVSQSKITTARGAPEARALLVRRASQLFSADLPLLEIYAQLAALLGSFVNARSVLVATRNDHGARLAYAYEDGSGGCPDDITIPPESLTAQVLRVGVPRLLRYAREWPPAAKPLTLAGRGTKPPASAIFVPVEFGGSFVGVLSVQSDEPEAYDEEDQALLEACAIYLGARMKSDERTGISTRAAFEHAVARDWARAVASRTSIGVLLVDADLFGAFYELYGHAAGDTCLRQIAAALAASLGEAEYLVTRYERDEFAVVVYGASDAQMLEYGRSIRAAVRALRIPHQGSSLWHVSVSTGVASRVPKQGDDWHAIVAEASADLARGKRSSDAAQRFAGRNNIPDPHSTFVGREREICEIEDALSNARVVTVAGPGGAGKTRVALEVARRALYRYPDGVWFVDLSSVRSAEAVARSMAAALDLESEVSDLADLVEVLRGKQLLVTLDNCEHLVVACAELLTALASGTSNVQVLTTSREPLSVSGERVLRLPPLDIGEAVELYFERTGTGAGANDRDAVEAIARKLDGLPMAIELAAARGAAIAPVELLETLSESLPGQQTLRALFDWSYKLLTPTEQTVLRRLSVFNGGWTLDAAIAICSDEAISGSAISDALESLSEKSLVLRETRDGIARFRFLETTRQYALQALERNAEDSASAERHLRWATTHALEMTHRKCELPYADWLHVQTLEFDNYSTALRRAFGALNDGLAAATILRSLSGLLVESPAFGEFGDILRARLQNESLADPLAAAYALALGEMMRTRRPSESADLASRAADAFLRIGDADGEAYAIWLLASAEQRSSGSVDRPTQTRIENVLATVRPHADRHLITGLLCARARSEAENGRDESAAVALREAADTVDHRDRAMLAAVIGCGAEAELLRGNIAEAIMLWSQAASLAEESRPSYAALCFINIGIGETMRGDLAVARSMLERGLSRAQATQHAFGIARAFDGFARLSKESGDLERAARIAGFAAARVSDGAPRGLGDQRLFDELIQEMRRKLGSYEFDSEYNRGMSLSLNEAVVEVA